MNASKDYVIETKCRRCDELTEWFSAKVEDTIWVVFMEKVWELMEYPKSLHCEKCKKDTVQDVVYYSGPEGE